MTSSHSLIRVLGEFESRVQALTIALADEAVRNTAPALAVAPLQPRASALRLASARRLWFLAPVPAEAFMSAGNRIATVAAPALMPMLAARALYACRDAIRRCVDRPTKLALSLSIGPAAFTALQAHVQAQAQALTSGSDRPLPDDLTAHALARQGWALMLADGACGHPTLRRIVELGLALAAGGDIWQSVLTPGRNAALETVAAMADAVTPGANGTDAFFSIAGYLFPEFQWLFG